jgi:TetR/AcrR family transcriptional regulator, transcriptional repressor for nem operon
MRYPKEHKDQVRGRIVDAASRRFRGRGGEGVAIADLMRDLGLTHGGFYRHFRGKDQLFREALAAGFAQSSQRLMSAASRAPEGRRLEAVVDAYLSLEHCANPEDGCPLAALATEIARHPRSVRAAFDRAVRELAATFAPLVPRRSAAERERTAMVLFSGMAGALNLARAASEQPRRRAILDRARAFYKEALRRRG